MLMRPNSIGIPKSMRILRTASPRSAKAQSGSSPPSLPTIGKGNIRGPPARAQHNPVTTAQHHLVKSKILKMPAIGEVHIFVAIGGISDRFRKQWPYRISGTGSTPCFGAWRSGVPEPPTQAHIKERHQET